MQAPAVWVWSSTIHASRPFPAGENAPLNPAPVQAARASATVMPTRFGTVTHGVGVGAGVGRGVGAGVGRGVGFGVGCGVGAAAGVGWMVAAGVAGASFSLPGAGVGLERLLAPG